MQSKKTLRKQALQQRSSLSPETVSSLNNALAGKVIGLLSETSFETLHTFLPILQHNEVDTWPVIRHFAPAKRIVIPRIVPGTRELVHDVLYDEGHLVTNSWGISEMEVSLAHSIDPTEIDVVLIPLLVFDRRGYRVGYGGGYYDRFLAKCKPDVLKLGLSAFSPVDAIEDLDAFDIRMDICVTPESVYTWTSRNL